MDEEYFSPKYVITKEAMGFAGYGFYAGKLDSNKSIVDCLFAKDSHDRVGFQSSSDSKLRIRNYSEEKYTVSFHNEGEDRHIMMNRNYGVPFAQDDTSVDKALKYFGYIRFGNTTPMHDYPGRRDSAIFVENGKKQLEVESHEIFAGGPRTMPQLDDYQIYISANAVSIHNELELDLLGDSKRDGKGLLYKYFMAESVFSVICVGDDPLQLETDASANLQVGLRSMRKILVLHKDFEI